jgi:tRNA(Ile)-lysidine synthase
MFNLSCRIPKNVEVAVSGGPDSVALLYFLLKSKRNVSAAFFHHKTETSEKSCLIVEDICSNFSVPLRTAFVSSECPKNHSLEDFWRKERYKFLESSDLPVVTGHHLDDAMEWWVFTSLRGEGKLIPRVRGKYLRPFLLNRKKDMIEFCNKNNLPYYVDETNFLTDRPRVLIRNKMMYDILEINPGLDKTIKKKYLKEIENERKSR